MYCNHLPIEHYNSCNSKKHFNFPIITGNNDKDHDSINDIQDLILGARAEAIRKPFYDPSYYSGGYPPDSIGVCTDVVWRAFRDAGYNLKKMIDADILKRYADYKHALTNGKPDPNIDFRRVKPQLIFFKKYAVNLTTEIKENDSANLVQWQGGDIVCFKGNEHIGIISDKRNKNGIPLFIHNCGPHAHEADDLLYWMKNCNGHFRYMK